MRYLDCRVVAVVLTLGFGTAPALAAELDTQPAASGKESAEAPESFRQLAADARSWSAARALLSTGEQHRLAVARRELELRAEFASEAVLDRVYDRVRATVCAGYVKLYRERLQRERALGEMPVRRGSGDGAAPAPSWKVRIEPKLSIDDHGYLSAKLSLPDAGSPLARRFTFEVRHGYAGGELGVVLRYRDGERRFLQLAGATGDRSTGERVAAAVAWSF